MKNNIIVAVVGMCGSGKTEVTEMFLKDGYSKVYFGDVTFDEMKRRGIPVNWENEKMMRETIRKEANGDKGIYALYCLPKIEEFYKSGNVLIESMYSWSEYKYVKEKYKDKFFVLAVVTNNALRKERLTNRPIRPMTAQDVDNRDYSEIENIEKGGPICIADYYVLNNGTKEDLEKEVKKIIKTLKEKNG